MADSQPFEFICKSFKVTLPTSDSPVLFANLSTWALLNLPPATVLSIPDRLRRQYGISAQFLENTLSQYIVQSAGMSEMISSMRAESIAGGDHGVSHTPKMVVSATKHYSWAKGVALTGIGSNNLVNIPVDARARIYIPALRSILEQHLASSTPIYAVVVTIGTTEEGAVDPLKEVLQLRDEFEKRGLCFLVHAGTSSLLSAHCPSNIFDRRSLADHSRWLQMPPGAATFQPRYVIPRRNGIHHGPGTHPPLSPRHSTPTMSRA